ncbi:MAG: chromosome segregation SMC family protein [Candidatus Micrarchaeota archaeon]
MFVQSVLLKNFKSFKQNEVKFEKGFNAIVGPNGSGKSNLSDALSFAFGESSLKSMRVKKSADLIFGNANIAEVTVFLSDESGNKSEVKRLVRRDGETKYLLNGKRVKKYVLEEFLSKQRLFTHNVIKQGEVQHIIEINSKDRRTLIDEVANVSEYEAKKKEALSELAQVDEKLKSAATILAEREGYLAELEQEKRDAEKYLELKKEFDVAKASLLYIDISIGTSEFESIVEVMSEFNDKLSEIRKKIDAFTAQLTTANNERQKLHEEILKRSQGKQLILQKEIDELTAVVERSRTIIEEKNSFVKMEDSKVNALKVEKVKADDEVRGYSIRMKELQKDVGDTSHILKRDQTELDKLLKESDAFTSDFHKAREFLERANNEVLSCKERLSNIQAETGKFSEIKKLKLAELERLHGGSGFEQLQSNKKSLKEKLQNAAKCSDIVERELNDLYSKEKRLNNELSEVEETLLAMRTKVAGFDSRLRTLRETDQNRAVVFIKTLENKGVYGSVEELCSYKDEQALAIQVSLGQRANYVVVDSSRTAAKVIEELKKSRNGRAAFIPLDKIRTSSRNSEDEKMSKTKSCLGFLIDFVEFDHAYAKAFQYIFGSTLLFSTLKDAESLIGKARIATLDGQLAEASGVMLGGSAVQKLNTARDRKLLDELKDQEKALQIAKDAALSGLYAMRDEMTVKRKEKAKCELELKAVEIELASVTAREEALTQKKSNLSAAISQLENEIKQCDNSVEKADEDRSALIRQLSDLNVKSLEAKQKIDLEKDKNFGFSIRERERKISDLKIALSDVTNQFASLKSQSSAYEKQANMLQKQLDDLNNELSAAASAIKEHSELVKKSNILLKEKQLEQRTLSSALKELYDKRDAIENQLQKIGTEKGKLEFERDKLDREVNSRNVRRAVLESQLTNLKVEYAPFEAIAIPQKETLSEASKPELLAHSRQLQSDIDSLGGVNLKAIELYSAKFSELQGQRSRVELLRTEKDAVLKLIDEIEGRKITTFMAAFNIINGNFKALFKQVFKGNGELFLENTENPFLGGLTIKVQLENKEVKYLELMSGGEKSLVALMFLFAIQTYNPSSVYILDEADAALDQENSRKLAMLVKKLSVDSQFLVVSHNQNVYKEADCLAGVAMTQNGSAIVEVKLNEEVQ